MLQRGDDFVFLQEAVEADDALGYVWHLAEYLEHDQAAGAFALRQVDRAHAAAADLSDAAMPTDHHRPEPIALLEIRLRAQNGPIIARFARGLRDAGDEPGAVELGTVEPVLPARFRRGRRRRRLHQHQHDGPE